MKYLLTLTLVLGIIFASASLVNAADLQSGTKNQNLSTRGDRGIPVEDFMTPEGRVDMEAIKRSAYQGSLDMDGFEVRLDADAGIQVMQSLYPSSAAGSKGDEGWSALGSGMNNCAYALAIYDNKLIAGGLFTMAGGASANFIASWNGSSWSTLGSGMDHYVFALTVYDGKLVAGGWFSIAGGVSANRIAAWDGSSWSPLGSGMGGGFPYVFSLFVYDNKLIAGGNFVTAGGATANRIASWDGVTWSALGLGMDDRVQALTSFNGNLIAGGQFYTAGGLSANYIAS